MFEDIEKFLKQNKKLIPNDGEGIKLEGKVTPQELIRGLKGVFGAGVEIREIKGAVGIGMPLVEGVNKEKLMGKLDGIVESMAKIARSAGLSPSCIDAKGKAIKTGNYLKCTNGARKKVLGVGYGYAKLSRADEFEAVDGYWFENEIKKAGFIKS